jgi:hypothetical protein
MLGPMDGYGCLALERKGVASASEGWNRMPARKRGPRGWKRKDRNRSILPPYSPAPFTPTDDWPTRSRSMMRYRGISISNFRIPNSVWLMEDWGIVINQKSGCGRL